MYISDAEDWVENITSIISNNSSGEILNSDHCSSQREYCLSPVSEEMKSRLERRII